jgi:hypothetical protein
VTLRYRWATTQSLAAREQAHGAAAEAARLTHQSALDRASLGYQVQSQLCDRGLALYHKVEELQRVIDCKQHQLAQQEQRLRGEIYVDFEARLKEMADKVDVAHSMEQGRDLAVRERLLTDMAALRKDTMLKLQLQAWMVRPPRGSHTPPGQRSPPGRRCSLCVVRRRAPHPPPSRPCTHGGFWLGRVRTERGRGWFTHLTRNGGGGLQRCKSCESSR